MREGRDPRLPSLCARSGTWLHRCRCSPPLRRCGIGIGAGVRPTRRSASRCRVMTSCPAANSELHGRSRSARPLTRCGRGSCRSDSERRGFYSNDLLDNAGRPSAEEIIEEFQHPAVGDWVPMFTRVNETTAFRITVINRPEELVWAKPDSTWAWKLTGRHARCHAAADALFAGISPEVRSSP
jgi:hypothetical protein